MKRILANRPSPAFVIACIALFVALGGVSYAVVAGSIDSAAIRNNSIRTQDVRNNDIRTSDIRNSTIRGRDVALNTLTGDDIDESKLSFSAARQEPVRFVDTPGAPPFAGNFKNASGSSNLRAGFWKDSAGVVHLQGRISGNTAGTIFTLPAGYRPPATAIFRVVGRPQADTNIEVGASGAVRLGNGGATSSLDGINFRAG